MAYDLTAAPSAARGLPRVTTGFTPTPAAARALASLPPLVVVQAPRGYGKTSTVSHWLRRPELPDHDVLWLSIARDTAVEVFRDQLTTGLRGLGHDLTGGWAALGRHARSRRRHVVVVADSLDRLVGDLDEELVEAAGQHENIHVVLLARAHRPAVTLALATDDAVVLRAQDLALGPEQTQRLAAAVGRPVAPEVAAELCAGLGGWPGLLRVALLAGGASDPAGPVSDYLRIVLQDLPAEVATAVAEAVTVPETVAVQTHRPRTEEERRVLERLVAAGLLRLMEDGTPTYPRLLHRAASAVLREARPAQYRHAQEVTARGRLAAGRAVEALHHATEAGNPDLLGEVLAAQWRQLLTADRATLSARLAALPARTLNASSVLTALAGHLLPGGPPRSFVELLQSELPVPEADRPDPAAAAALHDLGAALLAEADLLGAARGFYEAAVAGEGPARAESAAGVALTTAVLGLSVAAKAWLAAAATDEPGPLGRTAAAVIPSLVELDELRGIPEGVELAPLPPGLTWLTALGRHIEALRSLHVGRTVEALAETEEYLSTAPPADLVPFARALLAADVVDLCIATDQLARAREFLPGLVRELGRDVPWMRAAQARLALYCGDDAQALALSGDVLELVTTRCRAALKLAVTRAVAAHRAGRPRLAGEAMHLATRISERTGMLRPFVLAPRGDLDAIAAGLPQSQALLDRVDEAGVEAPFPVPVQVEQLSARELQVLRELGSDRPLPLMARRLYVSESTVKTQLRSIYRKFGVHTRAEAVERGRLLGLLPG